MIRKPSKIRRAREYAMDLLELVKMVAAGNTEFDQLEGIARDLIAKIEEGTQ